LREYDAAAEALRDADATVVVLTADKVDVLREAIAKQGFGQHFVSVDKSFWAQWGLRNRLSRKLPHPTTLVVAPDGRVVYREIHVNYTQRASVQTVVDLVRTHPVTPLAPPHVPPPPTREPDWNHAISVQARFEGEALLVIADVAPGFHVYGAMEDISRPLAVFVDQLPDLAVPIPDGERRTLSEALGPAWVLEGRVSLRAGLPPDAPDHLSGVLDYQVCTDAMCAPPESATWAAQR
jgi:hypothetical protein